MRIVSEKRKERKEGEEEKEGRKGRSREKRGDINAVRKKTEETGGDIRDLSCISGICKVHIKGEDRESNRE